MQDHRISTVGDIGGVKLLPSYKMAVLPLHLAE